MKKFLLICLSLSGLLWAQESPVTYSQRRVLGVNIQLVVADLASGQVELRPVLAPEGNTIPFTSLIRQGDNMLAAITGTFFDPATAITVGNVVRNGRLLTEGCVGSVLRIGEDGVAKVRSLEGKLGRHIDWADTQFAISAGPTLVSQGEECVAPSSEGFKDPGLFGARIRAAMGVTPSNQLLLLTTDQPVTLHELADIFLELGADEAVNLDGGSSTALYCDGSIITRPYRSLTNLIGVYEVGTAPDQSKELSGQYADAYQHYLKGSNLFRQGSYLKARSQVRKAISMAPDRPNYWETLAQIQEKEKSIADAATSFLKAAELYAERGQVEKARTCLKLSLELDPSQEQRVANLKQTLQM